MVDSDQRELLMRIQTAWHTRRGSSPGDPWSGRRLYNLLRAAGLIDRVVDGQLVWGDDLTHSDQIAGVLKKAHQAHELGAVSAAEVAQPGRRSCAHGTPKAASLRAASS